MVTVYHGTAAAYRARIESEGIVPFMGRGGYVYFASDRERALYYAKPTTAFAMTKVASDGSWPPLPDYDAPVRGEPVGLIVAASVPAKRLKDDPYNPLKEPGQFKVYRGIKPEQIVGFEEVEFPELRDEGERRLAFTKWFSIQRSLFTGF